MIYVYMYYQLHGKQNVFMIGVLEIISDKMLGYNLEQVLKDRFKKIKKIKLVRLCQKYTCMKPIQIEKQVQKICTNRQNDEQ